MGKKSKRGSGPRPGSNRAERIAERRARAEQSAAPAPRPFAGLAAECDLVALQSFVPSATVELPDALDGRRMRLVTVLPGAVPAEVRDADGSVLGSVALQYQPEPDDLGAALAGAIAWASSTDTGSVLERATDAPDAVLTDVLDPAAALDIVVHDDFDWWLADGAESNPQLEQVIAQAREAIMPSARIAVDAPGAPWWVDAGDRAHLRWVRPESEDEMMVALARLSAAGELTLGDGSKYAGSFRTHGLLVPVFDLDNDMHPDEWQAPVSAFAARLADALADTSELTAAQRRSRDGIRGRQVTLR